MHRPPAVQHPAQLPRNRLPRVCPRGVHESPAASIAAAASFQFPSPKAGSICGAGAGAGNELGIVTGTDPAVSAISVTSVSRSGACTLRRAIPCTPESSAHFPFASTRPVGFPSCGTRREDPPPPKSRWSESQEADPVRSGSMCFRISSSRPLPQLSSPPSKLLSGSMRWCSAGFKYRSI